MDLNSLNYSDLGSELDYLVYYLQNGIYLVNIMIHKILLFPYIFI